MCLTATAKPMLAALVAICLTYCCGCGDAVQEDRSIEWSGDGRAVGFQHGKEGVFVKTDNGKGVQNIFTPQPDVLATSTPLWSPDGTRVIFTTARAVESQQQQPDDQPGPKPHTEQLWDENPQGRRFRRQPIEYTCWLSDKLHGNQATTPVELFTARCDHVGYVAAGLAVRWHPDGNRILYIDQVARDTHAVFERDLSSCESRQVFPHTAQALLFDWSPDGTRLVCIVANNRDLLAPLGGIWIGDPDRQDWWHVQQSMPFVNADFTGGTIERLRALRLSWTQDGRRFAFAGSRSDAVDGKTKRFFLLGGDVESRRLRLLRVHDAELRDLHWSPGGEGLGFVQQGTVPSLILLDDQSRLSGPVNRAPVRRFVGWDSTGDQLAYVASDDTDDADRKRWDFLFQAQPDTRDNLMITDAAGSHPGRPVFSGMRVTFAHWSPREPKLSLWATFFPHYQSWWSKWFRWGLRPGDPAAILDVETGAVEWMPVNAREKIQVGHYYLLQKDYGRALDWYEQAEHELTLAASPGEPGRLSSPAARRDFALMHSYCLAKSGRDRDAQRKLNEFRTSWGTQSPVDDIATPNAESDSSDSPESSIVKLMLQLVEESYIGEVFLSLDAEEDGLELMQAEMNSADTDVKRLSRAVILSQFLLRESRHAEYARLASDTLFPLAIKLLPAPNDSASSDGGGALSDLPTLYVGAALLPLFSEEYLAELSRADLKELIGQWERAHDTVESESARLTVDLLLQAAYRQAGLGDRGTEIDARIAQSEGVKPVFPVDELRAMIDRLRRSESNTFNESTGAGALPNQSGIPPPQ